MAWSDHDPWPLAQPLNGPAPRTGRTASEGHLRAAGPRSPGRPEGAGPLSEGHFAGRRLALGFNAQVFAGFAMGDFHLPSLNKPLDDLDGCSGEFSAQYSLGVKATATFGIVWDRLGSRTMTQRSGTTGLRQILQFPRTTPQS